MDTDEEILKVSPLFSLFILLLSTFEQVNLEKVTKLKPVFKEGGTITAANASPLTDG